MEEIRIVQKIDAAGRVRSAPDANRARPLDAKCVRAIRESPLAQWYAERESKPAGKLPIPKFNPCDERRLALLVDELHEIRRVDPDEDTDYLKYQIDDVVCELYGLDDDEITFIYRALNLIHQTDDEEDEALAKWAAEAIAFDDPDDFVSEEEIMAILRGDDAS